MDRMLLIRVVLSDGGVDADGHFAGRGPDEALEELVAAALGRVQHGQENRLVFAGGLAANDESDHVLGEGVRGHLEQLGGGLGEFALGQEDVALSAGAFEGV